MKKILKRVAALAAVAALTLTSLVGCGVKDNAVVLTVGESEVTADMAKFFARYLQPQYEDFALAMLSQQYQMYYGSTLEMTELDWDMQYTEDATYAEDFKENYVIDTLKRLYLAKENMSEYNVELTDEELTKIEEAAKTFDEANDAETKEKVSASKELAAEYLELATIYQKVYDAILETVDRDVSDEDAAQKRLRYVSFAKTETDDAGATVELSEEEIATLKTEAETFLAEAKENGSLETYAKEKEATATAGTFGADYAEDESLTLDESIYKAADALAEVGFTELIETDTAFYVVQLESLFDEEATEDKKETIIAERETEKVTEVFEAWEESSKVDVNEKLWKRIDIGSLRVTAPAEETTDDTADDTTEDAADDTTEDTAEDTTSEDTATEE